MPIMLYDTLSHEKRPLAEKRGGLLGIYVCGVTPYAYTHLGHARVAVLWDVFRRYLAWRGFVVKFVQNFTDVDDKIIAKANQEGVSARELAQRYVDDYLEVMAKLEVAPADIHPRVTTEIDTIIAFIAGLVDKEFAYAAGGDVFYDVGRFAGYGKLSKRDVEEMEAGARIEINTAKRHPMDFALWKGAKPGEPAWESPWGPGRPGWHIECSAMSLKYLGENFDIHGGGLDLVFPHHENEIAQSEALTGQPLARFWVHNGMLNVAEEKMSKSLGNTLAVRDILTTWEPQVVRYFLISGHYRSPLTYSREELDNARKARERIVNLAGTLRELAAIDGTAGNDTTAPACAGELAAALRQKFTAAMDDDFNTALAVAALHDFVRDVNRLIAAGGLNQAELAAAAKDLLAAFDTVDGVLRVARPEVGAAGPSVQGHPADTALAEGLMDLVITLRQEARVNKDWARSDQLRDALKALGVALEDTPSGVRWKRVDA